MRYLLVRVDDPMHRWDDPAKTVKAVLSGYGPGIATVEITYDVREVAPGLVRTWGGDWELDTSPPWKCEAVISHGPGHQSTTRCERKTEHPIEGEHYALDPMCGSFEWTGPKGVAGYFG
jgi:hypothetical protein